jgi:predicted CopG family antitoxin
MSRTIRVSDKLYERLEAETRMRGFDSIEQLLEHLQTSNFESLHRQEVVRQIDDLRERLFAKYGEMADSTELLREDRAR